MTMKAVLRKIVVTLTIITLLFCCRSTVMKVAFSDSANGKIDLFTQKEPYSGKGSNVPSDAFGPGEVVILYALVTDGGVPLQNLLVTFYVQSPNWNSFSLTAETNASGIATIDFTIPQECVNETEFFGEWFTLANVLIGSKLFQDTLTFNVDWIIKLISVRAIDENLTHRTNFGIGGDVGIEITLRNIAMCMKSTTLAIVMQDELNVPISYSEIRNFEVQPNEKLIFLYCKLHIPKWAHVGKASILVSALTAPANQSGVAYCPVISTDFLIIPYAPLTIVLHDVAVINAVSSAISIESGQPLTISAVVRNEGTEVENFNVTIHFDDVLIGTLEAVALAQYSHVTLNFTFDTSAIDLGNYTITVSIPHLANEADLTDNVFVDGVVEVRPAVKQYHLTVRTDPPEIITILGEDWYNEGTNVTLTAPSHVPVSKDTRHKFSYWDIDGTSKSGNPIIVTVDTNHTATAHYVLQYYLTVTSPYSTPSGEDWYNTNTTAYATLGTNVVVHGNRTRRIFASWGGDASGTNYTQSNPILMDRPKVAVANWKTQSIITFDQTGLDSSASGTVLRIDEVPKTFGELLYGIWVNSGAVITYSYNNVSSTTLGKRFILTCVTGPVSPITVINPVTVTGNYKTQYYLTVGTDPPGVTTIPGEGWYDQCENVTLIASPVEGYDFGYWDVDGISQGIGVNTITVHMDNHHTATAYYSTRVMGWYVPDWFWWLLLLLVVLVVLLLIIWFYRRKRKKKAEESFYSGWTAWYYRHDLRNRSS